MAIHTTEIHDSRVLAAATPTLQGIRVGWGSVFSGFLVGIGIFLLLTTLGLAIGISTADVGPGEQIDARGAGLGAAIWSALTLLIALFVGGMVATRAGMVHDRATGMIEGMLVWVLSMLTIIWLATSGIGLLANTFSGLVGGVTQGATAAVRSVDVGELSRGDPEQIVARINDPQTAQLVAAATGMPQDEARSTLQQIAGRVEAARGDPARAAAEARQGLQQIASRAGERVERAAAEAQPAASATIWSTLAAMVVSLLAALGGSAIGRRQVVQRLEHA